MKETEVVIMKSGVLRFFSLLLTMTLLTSVIISCTHDVDDGGDDVTEPPVTGGFDPERTSLENAMAQYANLNYLRGEEIVILSTSPGPQLYYYSGAEENELWYEKPSSEMLSNAIYQRNSKLEEALGITIKPLWGGSPSEVNTLVTLNDSAGNHEFSAVLNRLDYEMTYAANGQLLNLRDIPSINVENNWWNSEIVDTFTFFGDKLYVIAGDINYYDDYAVNITIFNKDLCSAIRYEYPYQAVRDGTWTMDLMTEMAMAAKADRNGDDIFDPTTGDILGLADDNDTMFHFIYGYGLTMSNKNSEGKPEIVWANDINVSVIEKIYDIVNADYTYITNDTLATVEQFKRSRILFYTEMLGVLPTLRDMETDFGILPMPKGEQNMDGYRAYVSNGWSTSFAIPKTLSVEDAYDTGIVLECMSAASADIITPALYDQLLEARYIRDPESKEMLTYIFDSKVYDLANDLAWALPLRTTYKETRTSGPASFTRTMQKVKSSLEKSLDEFCAGLAG